MCIACSALLFGLYTLFFGSLTKQLVSAFPFGNVQSRSDVVEASPSKPKIAGLRWKLGFGVGLALPEAFAKPENQPQLAVFRMGATEIVVKDFVPSNFGEGTLQTLMLLLYGLAASICLHGPALLLGGKGDIVSVSKLALLYYFSGWLLGSLSGRFLVRSCW